MNTPRNRTLLGIGLLVLIAIIHTISAPDSFGEAPYKGMLFVANAVGCLIAVVGLAQQRSWGWSLGLIIAGSAAVGYILSRTTGLPSIPAEPDAWFEPLGIISLVAELWFVLTAAAVFMPRSRSLRH